MSSSPLLARPRRSLGALDGALLAAALLSIISLSLFGYLAGPLGPAPVPAASYRLISLSLTLGMTVCFCLLVLRQLRHLPGWGARIVPAAAIVTFFMWCIGSFLLPWTGNGFNTSWLSALYALGITSVVLIGVSMPIVVIAVVHQQLRQS